MKITAVILFHDEEYIDLKKTLISLNEEVDDIYIITTSTLPKDIEEQPTIVIIKDNSWDNDYSKIIKKNNYILPNNLLFSINVGEVLITKSIKSLIDNKNYKVSIVYDSTIVKESRICLKEKFIFSNKVFESIEDQTFELNKGIFINATNCKRKNYK